MNKTVQYYNQNAEQYFQSTLYSDMSEQYSKFLTVVGDNKGWYYVKKMDTFN